MTSRRRDPLRRSERGPGRGPAHPHRARSVHGRHRPSRDARGGVPSQRRRPRPDRVGRRRARPLDARRGCRDHGGRARGGRVPAPGPSEIPNYLRPVFHALAQDKVRYAGDPVAFVVAESRYLAEDARDAVEVEYEPLQAVVTMEQAADPALPPLFEDVGSNVMYTESMNLGEPDAAFAQADRVVSAMIDSARVTHVPMEGRGGVADYQIGSRRADLSRRIAGAARATSKPVRPAGASGRSPPCGDPRHRRGLRAEGRDLPRGPRRLRRHQAARPSGQMGRGPRREPGRRRSGARGDDRDRRRGEERRHDPRLWT